MTLGHTLLIPKKHYRWVHDVPEFGSYWEAALKIEQAVSRALNPNWTQFFTHGVVPHAHIHIIPRYEEVGSAGFLPDGKIEPPSKEEMTEIAEKIRNAF